MSEAQRLFYDEALKQLDDISRGATSQDTDPPPRRPKRMPREQLREFAKAKGLKIHGNQ
jgi:hypothetical protein